MAVSKDNLRAQILDKIAAHGQKKLSAEKFKIIAKFIHFFYEFIALEDLQKHSPLDLFGAALSYWNFIYTREPDAVKLRVYNPHPEQHGWQSTHTVVELCMQDMPFLVDSMCMELQRQGYAIHTLINIGAIKFQRDKKHKIEDVFAIDADAKGRSSEALILIEIDRQSDPEKLDALKQGLEGVLKDVMAAVNDWKPICGKLAGAIKELQTNQPQIAEEELTETVNFLKWVEDNHFTFLGYRQYELTETPDAKKKDARDDQAFKLVPGSGLGILRKEEQYSVYRSFSDLPEEARNYVLSNEQPLTLAKTREWSRVHRAAHLDVIGIKRFNKKGEMIGEHRILGLYTSAAYNKNPKSIPLLSHKVEQVMQHSRLPRAGHAGKALLNILETLPRDYLFQADAEELLKISMGILHLQDKARIRLFARHDIYQRFVSCLVFIPKDRYKTEFREEAQKILEKAFNAKETTFHTQFSESLMARIHFFMCTENGLPDDLDMQDVEAQLVELGRCWNDDLAENLVETLGEEAGNLYARKYHRAFPAGYKEDYHSRTAVYDIKFIESLEDNNDLAINFYQPQDDEHGSIRFKLYRLGQSIPLSDALPILENLGFRVIDEKPYGIQLADNSKAWINDFCVVHQHGLTVDVGAVREQFAEAFRRIWYGEAENDGFNRLIIGAQMNWREVTVLRAMAKYLKQIGFTFSQTYIEETLASNRDIARKIVDLFEMRFNPKNGVSNAQAISVLDAEIKEALDSVANLDQDRILRRFLDVIYATLRTNFYQDNVLNADKPYVSFKIAPEKIPEMPRPRPMFEIFVYSPRFEAVHLRGAKVARGGLRWSDRREDFRTEVLGLMKAQKVKNALIVPQGAKGGFVVKCLPVGGDRDAVMAEVVSCYKNFIRGMLDITDNIVDGNIIAPMHTNRYDEDDPYLVVAADKGTATFSDIANGISEEYGFWMADAFASGGSTGYDHKGMGITARGAWESVKRHFRQIGLNTQTETFTTIGIGDMGGDVFGNGMLLSNQIQLVGAFNHMHIFLDPNPDPAASFAERKRLFELPRSTWEDYDRAVLSKGALIVKRSDKSIKLTAEVKALLGLKCDKIVPNELIQAMLRARVDLLWNGGIGTYVKATTETHTEVGDRTNDALRINATELHCKVLGEGGNLGFTQSARVEFALKGGNVYTDFIDNSAGVDCSDHEVNIKILLNKVVENGDLTLKQRNKLLAEMTDEVAALVLRNNYKQTQAISIAASQSVEKADMYRRYISDLEKEGLLDRELEFLPSDQDLVERKAQGQGLSTPELAVILAYTKNITKGQILESELPNDPYLSTIVESAFPTPLIKKYRNEMDEHSLRTEIVATQLSNVMLDDMGCTFITRLQEETGAPVSAIVRAYFVAREVFGMRALVEKIESLDYKISSDIQYKMLLRVMRIVRRATRWFLRNRRHHLDIQSTVAFFAEGVSQFTEVYDEVVATSRSDLEAVGRAFTSAGVPEDLARQVAATGSILASLDVVEVARQHEYDVKEVARVYFHIGQRLDLAWFREELNAHAIESHWDRLALGAFRDDLDWQQCMLSIGVLEVQGQFENTSAQLKVWLEKYDILVKRWHAILTNMRASSSLETVMFSVALRELLDLTQTCNAVKNGGASPTKKSKPELVHMM